MRYIGSKEKVLPFIHGVLSEVFGTVEDVVIADLFCGTASVSKSLKKMGARLITNDYMAFSYILQNAYIENNFPPMFHSLYNVIEISEYNAILNYLNNYIGEKGFFSREYTMEGTRNDVYQRNYLSEENAHRIDSIRIVLREWHELGFIEARQFYILLASLIDAVTKVSNIAGTYGAFLKFDEKRKHKRLYLEPIEVISSKQMHQCYCEDIFNLIEHVTGDILYLDPPYSSRQYPPYYHLLETVALYDNPLIYGKTGRRPYQNKISPFCMKNKAGEAIKDIVRQARFQHIFISYSTEGLVGRDQMVKLLSTLGVVEVFEQDYRRYKSNGNGQTKGVLKELIYYVRK